LQVYNNIPNYPNPLHRREERGKKKREKEKNGGVFFALAMLASTNEGSLKKEEREKGGKPPAPPPPQKGGEKRNGMRCSVSYLFFFHSLFILQKRGEGKGRGGREGGQVGKATNVPALLVIEFRFQLYVSRRGEGREKEKEGGEKEREESSGPLATNGHSRTSLWKKEGGGRKKTKEKKKKGGGGEKDSTDAQMRAVHLKKSADAVDTT